MKRRWRTWLGTGIAVLVTLLAGEAIIRTEPDYYETTAAFYYKGGPGERVTADDIAVTVLGVRGAAKAGPKDGYYTDTVGVWIVVKVRVEALKKSATLAYVALADPQGRTFQATGRFKQGLGDFGVTLRPGIRTEGEVAFEVPRDDGRGLTLQMSTHVQAASQVFEKGAYTDITLPISEGDVTRWLKDPNPAAISAPTFSG